MSNILISNICNLGGTTTWIQQLTKSSGLIMRKCNLSKHIKYWGTDGLKFQKSSKEGMYLVINPTY